MSGLKAVVLWDIEAPHLSEGRQPSPALHKERASWGAKLQETDSQAPELLRGLEGDSERGNTSFYGGMT